MQPRSYYTIIIEARNESHNLPKLRNFARKQQLFSYDRWIYSWHQRPCQRVYHFMLFAGLIPAECRRQRISSNLNARPTINTLATIAIAKHRSSQIKRTLAPFHWEKQRNMSSMHLWLVRLLLPVIFQAEQISRYWRQVTQRPLYPTQPSFNEA